jgi:dTDP-4-dehydrorhamnose reductase
MGKPKICITGSGGLIGSHIARLLRDTMGDRGEIIGVTRHVLDLSVESEVRRWFEKTAPAAVIHCAGITSNPACEADPAMARLLNIDCCRWVFESVPDAWVCHFSTDLVFNGLKGNYREDDPVSPVGIYAETKAEAELIAAVHPHSCIVRTSLNGGVSPTGDRGFNEKLRQAWAAGQSMTLFTDEYRCPLAAEWTAKAVAALLKGRKSGVYHVAGGEKLSRYETAECVAQRWPGLNPQLKRGSIADYDGPPRSPDCSMDCSRITKVLGQPVPGLRQYLNDSPSIVF